MLLAPLGFLALIRAREQQWRCLRMSIGVVVEVWFEKARLSPVGAFPPTSFNQPRFVELRTPALVLKSF